MLLRDTVELPRSVLELYYARFKRYKRLPSQPIYTRDEIFRANTRSPNIWPPCLRPHVTRMNIFRPLFRAYGLFITSERPDMGLGDRFYTVRLIDAQGVIWPISDPHVFTRLVYAKALAAAILARFKAEQGAADGKGI